MKPGGRERAIAQLKRPTSGARAQRAKRQKTKREMRKILKANEKLKRPGREAKERQEKETRRVARALARISIGTALSDFGIISKRDRSRIFQHLCYLYGLRDPPKEAVVKADGGVVGVTKGVSVQGAFQAANELELGRFLRKKGIGLDKFMGRVAEVLGEVSEEIDRWVAERRPGGPRTRAIRAAVGILTAKLPLNRFDALVIQKARGKVAEVGARRFGVYTGKKYIVVLKRSGPKSAIIYGRRCKFVRWDNKENYRNSFKSAWKEAGFKPEKPLKPLPKSLPG